MRSRCSIAASLILTMDAFQAQDEVRPISSGWGLEAGRRLSGDNAIGGGQCCTGRKRIAVWSSETRHRRLPSGAYGFPPENTVATGPLLGARTGRMGLDPLLEKTLD